MSATRPQRWEEESLRVFYKTFHQAGQDWQQVGSRSLTGWGRGAVCVAS